MDRRRSDSYFRASKEPVRTSHSRETSLRISLHDITTHHRVTTDKWEYFQGKLKLVNIIEHALNLIVICATTPCVWPQKVNFAMGFAVRRSRCRSLRSLEAERPQAFYAVRDFSAQLLSQTLSMRGQSF